MKNSNLNTVVKIGVLGGLSFLIMLFEIPIPIFPAFLKLDLSDIPSLVGAFALGPVAGILIELVKNLVHFIFKPGTMGVGELANFIVGSAFVYTAGLIYKIKKNRSHAIIGLAVGTIAMSAVAGIANLYIFLPLYEKVLGFPMTEIIKWSSVANPKIKDLNTLIIYGIVPFNIFKGTVISIITFLSYKKLSPILHNKK